MHKIIIKKPIISEKSMKDAEKRKYTFEVSKSSHKDEIKKAIEKMFSVNVVSVTSTVTKGRSMRFGRRRTVKNLSSIKKATVFLKEGQSIALFEGGQK